MKKYQYLVEVADSPEFPITGPRHAWTRLNAVACQGRLGEFVVSAQTVTTRPVEELLKVKRPKPI